MKPRRPKSSQDQILEKLSESLIKSKEEIESKGLEESVKNTDNPDDVLKLIKKI